MTSETLKTDSAHTCPSLVDGRCIESLAAFSVRASEIEGKRDEQRLRNNLYKNN
ncbi:MAG: hypothetical protein ACU84J_12415 [Gammaproteobacteria bacterium]